MKFREGHKVLLRPIVTEKSTYLHSGGVYAFEVGVLATKPEIKKAVESIYKVKVVQVRVINLQGKRVRFGRMSGVRKDKKKALVTLQKGQTIELHKNV
ncbi:MAG: 50S ribosomal protein L23 [Candidatus Magasanikbacteria bacterium RIFOXYB2_FULL_38_10]|nr:MAG: 50S ribosomal protein L23 [Candidatus Magasanikbacteria bacterium RIFOXYB2_FULL_38_10]